MHVLVSLGPPFCGSPCSSNFCVTIEIMSDTTNELLDINDRDKSILRLDFVNNVPACETLIYDTTFKKARKLLSNFPVEDNGNYYGYIENLIKYVVYIDKSLEIVIADPCIGINAMDHSEKGHPYLKRDDNMALDKCKAEVSSS